MLTAVSAAVLKVGEMFLSGCIVGMTAYSTVKEAAKRGNK